MRQRVYLDACCLSRLTDDQGQARIRNEAEAVGRILGLVRRGRAIWVGSTVLEVEISRNPDKHRRREAQALLGLAGEMIVPGHNAVRRAASLQRLGFTAMDSLHVASAEEAHADVLLSTDDDLVRRAGRHAGELRVSVRNPVSWYEEVASDADRKDE